MTGDTTTENYTKGFQRHLDRKELHASGLVIQSKISFGKAIL